MKKLFYSASALVALLLAASCQQENLEPEVSASSVTYSVEVPQVETKAIGDGQNVDQLIYEVWRTAAKNDKTLAEAPGTERLYVGEAVVTNGTATFQVDLVNDQNYTLLFWAQVKDKGFYNTSDLKNVTFNQGKKWVANDDSRAAFYGIDHIDGEKPKAKETVELTRPFAQLNLGSVPRTEEQDKVYELTADQAFVKVTGAATSFNVATATAGNGTMTTAFAKADDPEESITVNGTDYDWVAMNYFFVPANQATVTVDYTIYTNHGEVTNTVENVPVQMNYRTNIIGNLLTSTTDYTVNLDKEWGGNDYFGPEFVKEPAYNAETKTYTIVNKYELLWVAQQVNDGLKTFKGETVQLAADIDLENKPWTPIGTNGKHFQGVFEGVSLTKAENNYPTISNLYIENGEYAGLFGTISNGALLRNFNLNHVRISGSDYLGAVVGQIYTTVENVTVTDAEITAVPYLLSDGVTYDGGAKVGGIAGLVGQSATIKECTVTDATFKAYRDMGGIVGTTQNNYPTTLIGNTVSDLTFIVTGFYTPYNGGDLPGHYAPIRGGKRSNDGDKIENNTGDDTTLHKVLVENVEGGIYDAQEKVYTVTSPAGLKNALAGAGAAGAGDHKIEIESDLDMTGIDWTPINVDGYHGADIVTVEGNGATIKGLDGALFAGGFAGGSGIVIKDLTIEGAHMIADNTQGYGAFVNCADSMEEITLLNCHLKNSTIITPNDGAAGSRIGGLVGWTAGYNNTNDGPVDSYITIRNCSVTGCTIKGAGSIGGICGHAGTNAATFTTIEDCTVTDNTLISTDDGGWRVGTVVGTANNGQCVIKNIISSGNTCSQTGKTAPVWHTDFYGRFVPSGTGNLTVDGVAMTDVEPKLVDGYSALFTDKDGNYVVYNKDGLVELNEYFVKNWCGNDTWNHEYHIGADIDAEGFTWNNVWVNVGNNANNGLVLDGNGHTISNMTIEGSLFTGTPNGGDAGTTPGYVKDIVIDNATVTGDHFTAVFWGNSYGELVYENVTVKNTKVTGSCNVAVFLGATVIENPSTSVDQVLFKNCSVENCTLVATGKEEQDPNGAAVYCARAYGNTALKFEGANSIDDATTITNGNGLVGGKVYGYTLHHNGEWVGTGFCDEFTNWSGLLVVDTEETFLQALKKGGLVLLSNDITVTNKWDRRNNGATTKVPVMIDGNNHTLNFNCELTDGNNYGAAFRFENNAEIKNLTIDMSNVTCRDLMLRAISSAGNLTIDNCTFVGNDAHAKDNAVVFGDSNASAQLNYEVSIVNSAFNNWRRGVSDNENAKEVKKVTMSGNKFTNASAYISVYECVTFTGNTMSDSQVNITSYTNSANVKVKAVDNTLDATQYNVIGGGGMIFTAANVEAQEGFVVNAQ